MLLNKLMLASTYTFIPAVRKGLRSVKPSIKAGLVQFSAALLTLLLTVFSLLVLPAQTHGWLQVLHWLPLLILHIILAQFLSKCLGMQPWWRWIHCALPLAVWGMLQFPVPDEFYLLGFLFSLSLYWTTYRTQVPFYPSGLTTWKQVLAMIPTYSQDAKFGIADVLPKDQRQKVVEIGSGLGGFSHYIAARRPDCDVLGVEVAPLPWLLSVLIGWVRGSRARFHLRSYEKLDFSEYDVIYAYLSPAAMPALWQKASREMRPGGLLISYEFEIPGVTPAMILQGKRPLYAWRITASSVTPTTTGTIVANKTLTSPNGNQLQGRFSRRYA